MSASYGKFVWYDLMTTDLKAAENFYAEVLGWQLADSGMKDRSYTLASIDGTMICGLMPIPPDAGPNARPSWMGYIGVDDVDAYIPRVKDAGGSIFHPPTDIPGIGRFAVVADLYGAAFYLFTAPGIPQHAAPGIPGHIGWRELHAGSLDEAFRFYAGLFGWQKTEAVDMGSSGVYQTFSAAGEPTGGIMTRMPQTPAPFWLYYFNVPSVQAAADRASQLGGIIINGPMEVPGGMFVVQMLDPQSAIFAVLGPRH